MRVHPVLSVKRFHAPLLLCCKSYSFAEICSDRAEAETRMRIPGIGEFVTWSRAHTTNVFAIVDAKTYRLTSVAST